MKRLFIQLQSENGYTHFLAILLFYFFIHYVTNEFIITESFLYKTLFGQVPEQYIHNFIDWQKKWLWLSYVIFPLILLLKWIFITAFIAMVSLFMDYKLGFKQVFKAIMGCEWLFILVSLINLFVLLFSDVNTMVDLERLNIIGKLSVGYWIADIKNLEWLAKPFEVLNLIQFIYILLLAYAIGFYSYKAFSRNLILIFRSYIPLLLIWVLLITYITVSYA